MTKSNSLACYHWLKSVTPNGCQTLSKMPCRYPENYPSAIQYGKEGHVWDHDGNEYIDLIAGLGAISVGYCNKVVNDMVMAQLNVGVTFSLPNSMEGHAAQTLGVLIPWTDMWKFGKNGTDGTVMAVRAARAYTDRTKVLSVGYNGCADQFEVNNQRNAGIPQVLAPTIQKATYNDIESFTCLKDETFACVIMEPMVSDFPKAGFLEALRDLCTETGTVLIFDEVVNGGRWEGFVSSDYFKVVPDIVVLSKGIANGFPLCAVGGTRRIMETFERDDFFASGTFGGECVSLAAFLATQTILNKSIPTRVANGRRIQESFNNPTWGAKCVGYPTRLVFEFPTDAHKYLFWQEMCKRSVLVGYTNFIMASHTDKDIQHIIKAIDESRTILKANWANPAALLEGPIPMPALRKS